MDGGEQGHAVPLRAAAHTRPSLCCRSPDQAGVGAAGTLTPPTGSLSPGVLREERLRGGKIRRFLPTLSNLVSRPPPLWRHRCPHVIRFLNQRYLVSDRNILLSFHRTFPDCRPGRPAGLYSCWKCMSLTCSSSLQTRKRIFSFLLS